MMKRIICTLAVLAMLTWTCPPARAQWMGELRRDIDWKVNVDNSPSAGPTAVTVHYLIGRNGEKEISRDEIEIGSVAATARTQLIFSNPGRGVRRIIIEVHQPLNVTIDVEIEQGGPFPRSFPARMERPGSLVFEVVD
jgi:hypothetical protein